MIDRGYGIFIFESFSISFKSSFIAGSVSPFLNNKNKSKLLFEKKNHAFASLDDPKIFWVKKNELN